MTTSTKLTPVTFATRKELIQALLDGRVFYNTSGTKIFYDERERVPFRAGAYGVDWNYSFLELREEVEVPWYENIPKQGVLCWVWDENKDERQFASIVLGHNANRRLPFISKAGVAWRHAKPMSLEEVKKYILEDKE